MPKTKIPTTLRKIASEASATHSVVFTDHALLRMWERQIDPRLAARAVRESDHRGASPLGPSYIRVDLRTNETPPRVVYVAYSETDTHGLGVPVIVTVAWRENRNGSV